MINFIETNNKLNENKSSLSITYPRTVNIIFGNFPYPEIIHNLMLEIKNNISEKDSYTSNVKGGKTDWKYFINHPHFIKFVTYLINKHQTTHPDNFLYFLERNEIQEAWGNEIKLNDSLNYHTHPHLHGILYLTEGCDLNLPELNLKITPKPGDYYIFPPEVVHGFEKSTFENNRYSLVFNVMQKGRFIFNKKLEEFNERKKSKHR